MSQTEQYLREKSTCGIMVTYQMLSGYLHNSTIVSCVCMSFYTLNITKIEHSKIRESFFSDK